MNLEGSIRAAWTVKGEIVAVVASNPSTQQANKFAVHYRKMLPGCELNNAGSVEWVDYVSIIDMPNGLITGTDASNVILEAQASHPERADVGKTSIANIWWSSTDDGDLHASIRAWPCEANLVPETAKAIEPFGLWRLEGSRWEREPGEAALAAYELDQDSRAVLIQSTPEGHLGKLYVESAGKHTKVAEDVLILSVPTPSR